MKQTVTTEFAGKTVTIETGKIAKQADGSVIVSSGNNIVMVTAVSSRRDSGLDFFPLTVEYIEKFFAAGKIPGGYFKREGRPTAKNILSCRLIDRPLRPLFPDGYRRDTQIIITVLSSDGTFPLDILASVGASTALHISDIPFGGPMASVQVSRVDGKFIGNPTNEEMEKSDFNVIVAGTRKGIAMVEGEADFVADEVAIEGLNFGYAALASIFDAQDELREKVGAPTKREFSMPEMDATFKAEAEAFLGPKIAMALTIKEKQDRYAAVDEAKAEAVEQFTAKLENDDEVAQVKKDLSEVTGGLKYNLARQEISQNKIRIDGRGLTDVRKISSEVGFLPRAHGSGLFTRGETQVIGTVTLGTSSDEQIIDEIHGTVKKRFMMHYNFPPYCVGETGRVGGQSRREFGHGFLAERSLEAILPSKEKFPYTIRVVGDVTESNGSSSMGTVCAGVLSLLDAGVPVKENVAGIAMGLIKEGDTYSILSDILGDEDHLGDMDFKVAGSRTGITALQMDIKIDSISPEIMAQAMKQALEGRTYILDEMEKVIKSPRGEVSEFAPRITTIKIKPEKVREVIGAGGKVIKGIIEETGVKVEIEDDGTVRIASTDPEAAKAAIKMVEDICAEAEVGKSYKGKVVKITDFGAFVEVLPNTSGLLHISEIAHERIKNVTDVLKEGDEIDVKVLDVDRAGRIKLSRKALLEQSTH
mgnify:FL=1